MIEKLARSSGSRLGYRVAGVVDKADYEALVPEVEEVVRQHGDVQLLLDLTDLKWERVTAWGADLKFGADFREHITRMAVVGDGFFQKIIAELAKPFYAQESAYFADEDAAWEWLAG